MTAPVAFQKVQIGKETTKGTAVAATELLLATLSVDTSMYEVFRNPHPFGVLTENAGPTALKRKGVELTLTADGATYEQIPWWLALSIDQPMTAGTGPYTHTFDPGAAAKWNPHSATIEARLASDGTNHEDVEFEYATATRLTLSGDMPDQVRVEANLVARQVTDAALTSLSLPATLNHILVPQMKVYINDTFTAADADAPASGLVSGQVLGFNLEIDTGQYALWAADGQQVFSRVEERQKSFTLRLNALYDPRATGLGPTERAKAANGDLRFVTLSFTGPGNLKMYIVLSGKHENGEFLTSGDHEGSVAFEMNLVGHYDPTSAKLLKAVVTNDDADPL